MHKGTILLLIKAFIIVTIMSILVWMFFFGGCLGLERVKLYGSNMKVDVAVLFVLFGNIFNLIFLNGLFFGKKANILVENESERVFAQLLI